MSPSEAAADDGAFAEIEGRHGRFLYGVHDAYIGASMAAYGEYSEIELQLLLRLFKPGATVVEAGANIGTHTVAMARRLGPAGRLIAFEPQPVIFQVLCANLALNGLDSVRAWPHALGAVAGEARIEAPDYAAPGNYGGVGVGDEGERVPLVRLDDAVDAAKVHLLKIDVEGAERDVLDGAAALIARDRPLIYLENDRIERSPALIRRLFEFDYRLFWHLPPMFNPDNFFANAENLFDRIVSVNMLCLPRERNVEAPNEITDPDEHPAKAWRAGP